MKISIVSILFGVTLYAVHAEERVFTNTEGKQITGTVETILAGKVHLRVSGRKFEVPFLSLSAEDQAWLREWTKANFNYKLTFREKAVEDVTSRTSERRGSAKTSTSRWHYEVDVENRSGIPVEDVVIEYLQVTRHSDIRDPGSGAKSKKEEATTLRGKQRVDRIENTGRFRFSSDAINSLDKSWTSSRQRTIRNADGTTDIETLYDNFQEKVDLDGIWIRVYKGERQIAEYKSEGKMIKEVTWE